MTEVTFGTSLGSGAFKTAYNVIYKPRDIRNNYIFTTDKDPSDLVMVITKINLNPSELVLNNKELNNFITELTYQYNLSINEQKLAPLIYKIKVIRKTYTILAGTQDYTLSEIDIDTFLANSHSYLNTNNNIVKIPTNQDDKLVIVVLEEKCGISISSNNNVIINENFITMVTNLVFSLTIQTNSLFKDFKIDNTCSVYDSSGNLINLIGLDFDPSFIESFNNIASIFNQNTNLLIDITEVQHMCQSIMIVQFLVYMLKYTRRLTEQDKIFIKSKLQEMLPENLLRIVSFFLYISSYTQNNTNISYKDICKEFPFIHYILTSTGRYNNEQTYSYNGYIMLLKELYIELSQIIYNDNTITESNVEFYPANSFARTVVLEQQVLIEDNNITLKINFLNEILHDYLEYLSCDVVKFLKQNGEQFLNNSFISNTIPYQIKKGIIENNKNTNFNENNLNTLISVLFNYIYTNKILYNDSNRGCKYYINTDVITIEEINKLQQLINLLTASASASASASGGKVNKRKKLTKRKINKRKLTKRKKKI